MSKNVVDLYEYTHENGVKVWGIRLNEDGSYTRFWGKKGSKLQSKGKERLTYEQAAELVNSKTGKGYVFSKKGIVDESGYFKEMMALPPSIHYQISKRGIIESRSELEQVILEAKEAILSFLKSITLRERADLNSFTETLLAKGYHAGQITQEMGIYPLMILYKLMATDYLGFQTRLAYEDGEALSMSLKHQTKAFDFYGTSFENIRPLAEALELVQKRIDLSNFESNQPSFYF